MTKNLSRQTVDVRRMTALTQCAVGAKWDENSYIMQHESPTWFISEKKNWLNSVIVSSGSWRGEQWIFPFQESLPAMVRSHCTRAEPGVRVGTGPGTMGYYMQNCLHYTRNWNRTRPPVPFPCNVNVSLLEVSCRKDGILRRGSSHREEGASFQPDPVHHGIGTHLQTDWQTQLKMLPSVITRSTRPVRLNVS